jgi:hypothetical protein
VLPGGTLAGFFDEALVGAKGDILHDYHTSPQESCTRESCGSQLRTQGRVGIRGGGGSRPEMALLRRARSCCLHRDECFNQRRAPNASVALSLGLSPIDPLRNTAALSLRLRYGQ